MGEKRYELSNHLGNVLAVITDRRFATEDAGATGNVKYYEPDVVAAQEYAPFGMLLTGRSWEDGSGYRYGFNDKEYDSEQLGEGNVYDYGFRIYNPQLGKFLSVDPIASSYPELTPYQFASNRPIDGLDLDGLEYIDFIMYERVNADGPTTWIGGFKDNRNMTDDQIRAIHHMSPKRFRRKYSETFGEEGQGIKWTYYFANGEKKEYWEMNQNSIAGSIEYYGLYSGQGCITLNGPREDVQGPNSIGLKIQNAYDFSFNPIDYPDMISKIHDAWQSPIVDNQGWLEDSRHWASNIWLLNMAQNSPDNMSREADQRIRRMIFLFEAVTTYNEWKYNWLLSNGYDPSLAYNQQFVSLSDWDTKAFSRERKMKKRLLIAGGGKSKEEMGDYWKTKDSQ